MSWFDVLKQNPQLAQLRRDINADEMRAQPSMPPTFSPEGVQYYSTPTDTSQQMDNARFFEEQRLRREGK